MTSNLRGMALMAAASLVFATEVLFLRWMNDRGIPTTTQVLFRSMGQLVWIIPALLAGGAFVFRTTRPFMHVARGLCSLVTWGLYFLSFRYLDPATGTVLSFTNVMFTTMLAGPLLAERVGRARWAGTLLGLAGVAVMLRPGTGINPLGAAIALGAAAAWGGTTMTSRMLTRTESTPTVIAWVWVVTSIGITPFAIAGWAPLSAGDVAVLTVFGCVTPAILWLVTEALRAGEASAVAPVQYLRLPVVALAGWLIWNETPDAAAWAGAAVILSGAVVITLAETRRRVTP